MAEGKTITIIQKGKSIDPIHISIQLIFTTAWNGCYDEQTEYWLGFKVLNTDKELETIGTNNIYIETAFKWSWNNGFDGGHGEEILYPFGAYLEPGKKDYVSSKMTVDSAKNLHGDISSRIAVNLTTTASMRTNLPFIDKNFGHVQIYEQGDCNHQIYYPSLDGHNGIPIYNNM